MPSLDPAGLTDHLRTLGFAVGELHHIGDGWWSTCFAFDDAQRSLVVRVGRSREFFAKDAIAARWSSPALPIPRVYAVERHDDAWLCVSDRADGVPLEHLPEGAFHELVPGLITAFDALGAAEPAGDGWGEWDHHGDGRFPTWRSFLDSAFGASHDPTFRSAEWRDDLDAHLSKVVDVAEERLATLNIDNAPRALVHGDLLHRNVHVDAGRLSGIFDWGAASYADPMYEPACFEYWEPWHSELGIGRLLTQLAPSAEPEAEDRRAACLIHIGVTHIAFTAARLENLDSAHEVADRLEALVEL